MDKIQAWLDTTAYKDFEIEVASADASFRAYYRLTKANKKFLLMDSSLELDSLIPFINVTLKLLSVHVKAPKILEQNLKAGYLILEDFGSTHYLDILDLDNFENLYKKAIDEIVKMQEADTSGLPIYDKDFLTFEMDLMSEWYMIELLPVVLSNKQKEIIRKTIDDVSDEILKQPQGVFVHRDFHSRNIMQTTQGEVGIIDYQDAMSGALCYDIASLLEDSYIEFEREDILKLVLYFRDKKGIKVDDATFIRWFDFISMQRHMKVLGIFSRLYKRDGKKGYLKDIPLTLRYLFDTAKLYEETKPLNQMFKEI
ncbi:MAG: aminoglycoside/choline kinase family phosphotransferase [Sulfurimonas sp.]|jgi:aminoglycoside/choline kinase family phosphotransferase|uniref:aminoglycoside phosphotransferase family protein n=1 Tax=Sulfurimonas sp. TaxID=2022749 RepID=UPI0039E6DE5D